jgi:nucleolar protein 14
MAKGSQLAQLKSALASAGLNRQSQPGGSKGGKDSQAAKKRKRGPDDEKKLAKIRKDLNPFEERVMRVRRRR